MVSDMREERPFPLPRFRHFRRRHDDTRRGRCGQAWRARPADTSANDGGSAAGSARAAPTPTRVGVVWRAIRAGRTRLPGRSAPVARRCGRAPAPRYGAAGPRVRGLGYGGALACLRATARRGRLAVRPRREMRAARTPIRRYSGRPTPSGRRRRLPLRVRPRPRPVSRSPERTRTGRDEIPTARARPDSLAAR